MPLWRARLDDGLDTVVLEFERFAKGQRLPAYSVVRDAGVFAGRRRRALGAGALRSGALFGG